MSFITMWAQGIIVAVIISTIIEMLLPNNSNGKYVKVVIGMFVLFTIISPVINKFKGGESISTNADDYIENYQNKAVQTSSAGISLNNQDAIKRMYEENLKIDIKSKVNQKGYIIDDVKLEILDNSDYTLNRIEFRVTGINGTNGNNQGNGANNTTTIIENIENIKVSLGGSGKDEKKEEKSVISESEKRKLRDYLSGVYEVKENNIDIY